MKHGSLFSGIGGFDLASHWMGWENVFHCEIEPFPRKVLKHYFPNSICYEDIKSTYGYFPDGIYFNQLLFRQRLADCQSRIGWNRSCSDQAAPGGGALPALPGGGDGR